MSWTQDLTEEEWELLGITSGDTRNPVCVLRDAAVTLRRLRRRLRIAEVERDIWRLENDATAEANDPNTMGEYHHIQARIEPLQGRLEQLRAEAIEDGNQG